MELLTEHRTINLFSKGSPGDQELGTHWLFGPARGKMFGILECARPDGTPTFLRAFSGQYLGHWLVEGWAPPLFAVDTYTGICENGDRHIKNLDQDIARCQGQSDDWRALRKKRRLISQTMMQELHSIYQLSNFRGKTADLAEAFIASSGIPTGTGDCCAPKLLNLAARQGLYPLGLAEFYWGKENRSGTRRHGAFSSACKEKCQPILGFMLCGLDKITTD